MIEPNPFDTLWQMATGYCLSRCLHVVADLGVADVLDETPKTSADLASSVGADPDALGRILRLLASHGVFEVRGDGFVHSPASRMLRGDHPRSMRDHARMWGLPVFWRTFEAMEHSARTGLPAMPTVFPEGLWARLAGHPEEARVFNGAMVAKARGAISGILASYDFSGFGRVGDIGGGSGHLLRAVLDDAPNARGVLFDLPHVIEEASVASERLTLQTGDFFRDELPECDAYLLMEVIHDWGDEESVAILQAVRRAAPAGAKLLVLESIVPEDPGPDRSKTLDIVMLTLLGGRQRTRQEYEEILAQSGFLLQREIDTHAGISILEAEAV
ncbi:MAG: methyltransferase [Rubrobacteraceae bacterium]